MVTFVAHTVKGLEPITKLELNNNFSDPNILSIQPKKIIFQTSLFPNSSLLKTFDDLSLLVEQADITDGSDIIDLIDSINLKKFKKILSKHRLIKDTFSITISSYKNRQIDKQGVKKNAAELIKNTYMWSYTPLKHTNFDIRIQIEKKKVLLLIKIFSKSLFFRKYRIKSQKGAIRPSIAGAMLYYLTKGKNGYRVVDNFCGSGTFLCEGLIDENKVYGGDISRKSVQIAKSNLSTISHDFSVKKLDAKNTDWQDDYFDIAISNLPWDKQITVDHFTRLYAKSILEYGRILKPDGCVGLIGSKPDLIVKYIKQIFPNRGDDHIEVFKIGYLGQRPSIVFCH
jgi:23S rRNA G2445 N2-methylase RlmL